MRGGRCEIRAGVSDMAIMPSLNLTSKIDRVAIIYNGVIYSLPRPNRHHDVIRHIHEVTGATTIDGDQGFMTNDGQFVGRRQARLIAERSGQLLPRASKGKELYSEDVW